MTNPSPDSLQDSVSQPGLGKGEVREVLDSLERAAVLEEQRAKSDRTLVYGAQFVQDLSEMPDDTNWEEFIYVAIVVVVVGGVLLYLPRLIFKGFRGDQEDWFFQETFAGYTYSGANWEGGGGDLFRDTHMASLRHTVVFKDGLIGLGAGIEGGYLGTRLTDVTRPGVSYRFSGAYLLAGPHLHIGTRGPFSMGLDYFNGTSTADEVGWVSKARWAIQYRLASGLVPGVSLGAMFYDLRFFDGLVWRRGQFNRDITLQAGLSLGWAW